MASKESNAKRVIDITGQRFGRLTAVERMPRVGVRKNGNWRFQCDCGNFISVRCDRVMNRATKSCGCEAGTPPGLTGPLARMCKVVFDHPQGIRAKDAAEILGICYSFATSSLTTLGKLGHIGVTRRGPQALWAKADCLEAVRQANAKPVKERADVEPEDPNDGRFTHIHRPAGSWQHNGPVANNSIFNLSA